MKLKVLDADIQNSKTLRFKSQWDAAHYLAAEDCPIAFALARTFEVPNNSISCFLESLSVWAEGKVIFNADTTKVMKGYIKRWDTKWKAEPRTFII